MTVRSIILIIILAFMAAGFLPGQTPAGDEAATVWTSIYRRAGSFYQQYNILRQIIEQNSRAYIPFLTSELHELVFQNHIELQASSGNEMRKSIMRLIMKQLGDFRVKQTGPEYFRVFKEGIDPFLRQEAVIALGKAGVRDYNYDIIMILRNLNLYGRTEGPEAEVVAMGCVSALRRLRDPESYETVFFAAEAGYTSMVTNAAERALPQIMDDPTPILKRIVKDDSLFRIKFMALKRAAESRAPAEGKKDVAVEALTQGIVNKGVYPKDTATLRDMRLLAMNTLKKIEAKDERIPPLVERILFTEQDINERITCLELLGVTGGDRSGEILLSFLAGQNDRSAKGMQVDDKRYLITAIRSLGKTGYKKAYEELLRVKYVEMPYDVVLESEQALKAMGYE